MQRIVLLILGCFWAFMGFRLWQVEYGGKRLGAAVDIAIVWDKVLTAQDEAPLAIVNEHSGEHFGFVNWAPSVTRDDTVERSEVEGMVDTVLDYSLDLERGELYGRSYGNDVRFNFHIGFGPPPDRAWTDVQFTVKQREPLDYEFTLNAQATNEFMTLSMMISERTNEVPVPYADFGEPKALLKHGLKLAGFHPAIATVTAAGLNQLLKKEELNVPLKFQLPRIEQAHFDLLPGVRSKIKVYRVDVPVASNLFIKIYISMLGEVLRVEIPELLTDMVGQSLKLELPKGIVLRNTHFYGQAKRRRNR